MFTYAIELAIIAAFDGPLFILRLRFNFGGTLGVWLTTLFCLLGYKLLSESDCDLFLAISSLGMSLFVAILPKSVEEAEDTSFSGTSCSLLLSFYIW